VTGESLLPTSCFTTASLQTSRSKMVTLSFASGASDAFINALNHQPGFPADEFGVRYNIETHVTETIGEMKGGKWMAYAARALIVRFWELTRVSSPKHMVSYSCHTHLQSRKRIHWTSCSFSSVTSSCTHHLFACSSQRAHLVPT
jgi:hypothetical protein